MLALIRRPLASWLGPAVLLAGAFLLGRAFGGGAAPEPPPVVVEPAPAPGAVDPGPSELTALLFTPIDMEGLVALGAGANASVTPEMALEHLLEGPLGRHLGPEARALLDALAGELPDG